MILLQLTIFLKHLYKHPQLGQHTINTAKTIPHVPANNLSSSAHFNSFDESKNSVTVIDQDDKSMDYQQIQLTEIAMLFVRVYKFKAAKVQTLQKQLLIQHTNNYSSNNIPHSKQEKTQFTQNQLNQIKYNIKTTQVLLRQLQQEKQIANEYQRFMTDALNQKQYKTFNKRSSKNLPSLQKVTQLDMQNAIEELRGIKKIQNLVSERQTLQEAKLRKEIHELRTLIKQKEELLKQINCQYFVKYIHRNIGKDRSENKLQLLSKKQMITRNSLKSIKLEQNNVKYSLFVGNQKLKSEAVCIKDTKILKEFRYNLFMIKFFVSQDQLGFQCYYGNQNRIEEGQIHSWTGENLITQSIKLPLVVRMDQLYSFSIYYDKKIRGFELFFRNKSYKIIGERRQKYIKEEFMMNHKTIKYLASYWYNSQMIGVTIGYRKIIHQNRNRNSLQHHLQNTKTQDECTPYRQYYV